MADSTSTLPPRRSRKQPGGSRLAPLGLVVTGVFMRGLPRWRRFGTWLLLGSPLTLLLVVLFLTVNQAATVAGHGVAGLTQRVLTVEVLA